MIMRQAQRPLLAACSPCPPALTPASMGDKHASSRGEEDGGEASSLGVGSLLRVKAGSSVVRG